MRSIAASAAGLALVACGLNPIAIGPKDLITTGPEVPKCEDLQYPFRALQDAHRGNVILLVSVAANGQVAQATLAQSSGSEWLDATSLAAAKQCVFPTQATPEARSVQLVFAWDLIARPNLPEGRYKVGVLPAAKSGT